MRTAAKPTRYPGVHKISDGSYRLRIKYRELKTGMQREVDRVLHGLTSLSEAVRQREELRAQLEAGDLKTRPRKRVEDCAHSWLTSKLLTIKPSTAQRYAESFDLHITPAIGMMYIDAVEQADIVDFRDGKVADDYHANTVNGWLRILRTFFGDTVAELDLPRDPTARVKTLPVPSKDDDHNCLTLHELQLLLSAAQQACPQYYVLLRTLAETGTRISECTALRWEDIDDKRLELRVRRSHWRGIVGTTKTKRTRTLPITEQLAEVLAAHRRQLLQVQAPGLAEGWMFPSETGTLRSHSALQKPLATAVEASGISRHFTLHGFRHTFNNLLRRATTGEVVRSMTGHVTERMTEHYSHVEVGEKREALTRAFAPLLVTL
jgi:integrase